MYKLPEEPSPLLRQAFREYQRLAAIHPEPEANEWKLAFKTSQKALQWRLPEESVIAALLTPLINHDLISDDALKSTFGSKPLELAHYILDWHIFSHSSTNYPDPNIERSTYSFKLRTLLRQIYQDYPDLQSVLLLIAAHDSHFDIVPSLRLARLTKGIFIPLAEALGLWKLHRHWLSEITAIAASENSGERREYQHICMLAKELQWDSFKEMVRFYLQKKQDRPTKVPNTIISKEDRRRYEKAESFFILRSVLRHCARQSGFSHPPKIQIRQFHPGQIFHRALVGTPPEEILNQLWVRVLCDSVADCYRLLGIVHNLGQPVAPRFSERFDDFIADCRPNGYRALHTAIVFTPNDHNPKASFKGNILIELRILTPEMHKVNEWGVIESLYRNPHLYECDEGYQSSWWSPKFIEKTINRINHLQRSNIKSKSLKDFIKEHDLNTRSIPLYIFTPRGQIIIIEDGSTALDFAYQIHSQLGNHAVQIEVNDQSVGYGHHPNNGDIINVYYDANFQGPDISWLTLVTTPKAKKVIRRMFAPRSFAIHPGRLAIQEDLLKTIHYYQRVKGYQLLITNSVLEEFLLKYSRARGLPSIDSLFEAIRSKRESPSDILPHRIVQRLISDELVGALVDQNGLPLASHNYYINLCDGCRPVPGETILAIEHKMGSIKRYTVHIQNCLLLKREKEHGKQIPVRWMEKTVFSGQEIAEFHIFAEDHKRLLDDVIHCVYQTPHCYLHKVDARAERDRSAVIRFTISCQQIETLTEIHQKVEKVSGVRQVWYLSVSPYQRAEIFLGLPDPSVVYNPFTEQIAQDRSNFYDREEQVLEILGWLQDPKACNWLILHGQRRVGKTSLAKYLIATVLHEHRVVHPVYISMEGLSKGKPYNLAAYLLGEIYYTLGQTPPPRKSYEEPAAWLRRGLEMAYKELKELPLFIILDEFDRLIAYEREEKLDPLLFSNLIAVMNQGVNVRWLLVLQETEYQDYSLRSNANPIIQKADSVFIANFEESYAYRFIQEKFDSIGFSLSLSKDLTGNQKYRQQFNGNNSVHPFVKQIYDLGGGIPYYMKKVGYHIVDNLREQGRSNVTADDLQQAIKDVMHNGQKYFADLLPGGTRKLVLQVVAKLASQNQWASIPDLLSNLSKSRPEFNEQNILEILNILERQGFVLKTTVDGIKITCVSVPLFSMWIRDYLHI